MAIPNLGPITYGKDFFVFKKIVVNTPTFNTNCDVFIDRTVDSISLVNDGYGIVEVSFNGFTVHSELDPSTGISNITITDNKISKIWLRLKSGPTSTVRIQSNTKVNNNSINNYNGDVIYNVQDSLVAPNSPLIDAFGRQKVSNPYTLFESKQLFDARSFLWSEQLVSGASSNYSANRASTTLTVSSTTGSSAIRQSKYRQNYQPGKSFTIMETFVMGATASGIIKRVGYFDAYNGLFLQNSGGALSFVIRSNVSGSPTDDVVLQSLWNIDKFDGTGPSGKILDITKAQILYIDLEWLGVGSVRFGFFIDGSLYYAHKFNHANLISSAYMSNPNLPIRYEVSNVSSVSSSTLEQICSTVLSDGGYENKGIIFSADRGIVSLVNVGNLLAPVVSIKLDTSKSGVSIAPIGIEILCSSSNANFRWALILNPTIGGVDTASWTSLTNSAVQYDVSRTVANTISGGTLIKSGYGSQKVVVSQSDLDTLLTLGVDLSNVSDQLVLAVHKPGGGTDDFLGSIIWKEYS